MFHARVLLIVCLMSPVVAEEAPPVEAPSIAVEAATAFKKVGAPTDLSAKGIGVWVVMFVIIAGIGYAAKKYRDNDDFHKFALDVGAAVDTVYIEKLEKAKGKLDGSVLRDAGMLFLSEMKGPTARIIAKKGKPWVMAQIHRIANRKKKEGTDLKISKATAAPDPRIALSKSADEA